MYHTSLAVNLRRVRALLSGLATRAGSRYSALVERSSCAVSGGKGSRACSHRIEESVRVPVRLGEHLGCARLEMAAQRVLRVAKHRDSIVPAMSRLLASTCMRRNVAFAERGVDTL